MDDTRARILIADNCKDFVGILVRFLSRYPEIEIIDVAYNGADTVEKVERLNPDVLLLDIIMPEMDGLEALRRIRQIDKEVQVLLMSAIDITRFIENTADLNYKRYFVKPFDLDDVLQAILD